MKIKSKDWYLGFIRKTCFLDKNWSDPARMAFFFFVLLSPFRPKYVGDA